ncbi:hypothetical protein [Sporichthya polymorpha]|uniref:hypothetical protein n=1 Tax=Sporichthya polymorpha TaxID=35751 RepID=UPI00037867A2|nr:hypothetical protein [Sporichthya polymorpha]
MSGKQSKTSRASVRAGAGAASGAVNVLGEVKYVIPLNQGKNAYIRNITTGRTPNVRTNSDAFVEEIRTLAAAGHGAKIKAELEALATEFPGQGWDAALQRLVDAEALS